MVNGDDAIECRFKNRRLVRLTLSQSFFVLLAFGDIQRYGRDYSRPKGICKGFKRTPKPGRGAGHMEWYTSRCYLAGHLNTLRVRSPGEFASCSPNKLAARLAQHTFRGWVEVKKPQVNRLAILIHNNFLNHKGLMHILKKPAIALFTFHQIVPGLDAFDLRSMEHVGIPPDQSRKNDHI